jgi:periplasmic protein CpxP/Spy
MDEQNATTGGGTPRGSRRWILYGLLGAGALVSLVTVAAARPIMAAVQGAEGWHRHWGGHGRFAFDSINPEAAREHLQVAAKWALRDIDATEEQQEKINTIVTGAVDDLFALRDRHRANRQAFHDELTAAKVDRAALEETRKAEIALADEASKRLVQALADISDVLTPEQRQALVQKIHRHHAD